jgi:transcriptional regulator with XRE-family HTH domain
VNVSKASKFVQKRLLELKTLNGWSNVDFAKKTGLHGPQISDYLNGHKVPSIDTLEKIAKATGVNLNYFVDTEAVAPEISRNIHPEEALKVLTELVKGKSNAIPISQPGPRNAAEGSAVLTNLSQDQLNMIEMAFEKEPELMKRVCLSIINNNYNILNALRIPVGIPVDLEPYEGKRSDSTVGRSASNKKRGSGA